MYGSNGIYRLIFEKIIYLLFGNKDFKVLLTKFKIKNEDKDEEILLIKSFNI